MYKIRKGNFETNSSSADYYREEAEEEAYDILEILGKL